MRPAGLRGATYALHRPATGEAVRPACEPVVGCVLALSGKLGFGFRPTTLVDREPALDFIKREVINEARHPVLMDVPAIGVLANVGAILEHLVEILRREPVSARCTDSLRI